MQTFLWHDYETFGADPRRDRPVQFGAIRTDQNLSPVAEPEMFYCAPPLDTLPHPQACLITGISPQKAAREGSKEVEFADRIRSLMMQPGTCSVGYNSLRFDDEFTRNLMYRNFFDPYEREYAQGNSRFDLIDLTRATYALRPAGINWPTHDDGKPSFRLEDLSRVNGIEHGQAHDALADVRATLALAKLLKTAQLRLFEYALTLRSQKTVARLTNPDSGQEIIHSSSRIAAERGCTSLVLPLSKHPRLPKSVLAVDLNADLEPLLDEDVDDLRDRLFTPRKDLPDGVDRIPLKAIATNRVPFVAPAGVLRDADCERIGLDLALCKANAKLLRANPEVAVKVAQLYSDYDFPAETDPDLMIYAGSFFNAVDKAHFREIHTSSAEQLAAKQFDFTDPRLPELLFRYRARNWPESLNHDELSQWQLFRKRRLLEPEGGASLCLAEYRQIITEQRARPDLDAASLALLDQLEAWTMELGTDTLERLDMALDSSL